MAKFTESPWQFRKYLNEPGDIELLRSIGQEPVRALNNDGSASITSNHGRIATVDLRREDVKRTERYGADDEERDANARLIAAAPAMYAALLNAEQYISRADDCNDMAEVLQEIEDALAQCGDTEA